MLQLDLTFDTLLITDHKQVVHDLPQKWPAVWLELADVWLRLSAELPSSSEKLLWHTCASCQMHTSYFEA